MKPASFGIAILLALLLAAVVAGVTGCGWFGEEEDQDGPDGERGQGIGSSPAAMASGWEFAPVVDTGRRIAVAVDAVVTGQGRTAVAIEATRAGRVRVRDSMWVLEADTERTYEQVAAEDGVEPDVGEVASGWLIFDGEVAEGASSVTLTSEDDNVDVSLPLPVREHEAADELSPEAVAELDVPSSTRWEVEALPLSELEVSEPITSDEREVREILAGLDAEVVDDGVMVTFPNDVLFAFDEADLTGRGRDLIADMATAVAHYAGDDVFVYGHTDAVGEADYNQALSQERAQAVAGELVEAHGVEAGRITVEGFGETQPVAPNETADGADNPDGRALNRRVEVLIATDDERLVDVDSADVEAAGEAGGVTVEVTGVSLGQLTVELDVTIRNNHEAETASLSPASAGRDNDPLLRDDLGQVDYIYTHEYGYAAAPAFEGEIAVEPSTEVDLTLKWFGEPPAEAETLQLTFNPAERAVPLGPELTVDDIPVPDRDAETDTPAGDGDLAADTAPSPGSEQPTARYGADAVRAVRTDRLGRIDWALLKVTGIRSYPTHTVVDIAMAHRRPGDAGLALDYGTAPRGLMLSDDRDNAYWIVKDDDDPNLTVPAASLMTGELVFVGRLDPRATTLELTTNANDPNAPQIVINDIELLPEPDHRD